MYKHLVLYCLLHLLVFLEFGDLRHICKTWDSDESEYPNPLVELKSLEEYLYLKPGRTFKKISFKIRLRRSFSKSFLSEEPLVITFKDVDNITNENGLTTSKPEGWLRIKITVYEDKHLFQPDTFIISAKLDGGKEFKIDTGYWHSGYSFKGIAVSILGDAQATFSCTPESLQLTEGRQIPTEEYEDNFAIWKNPNLWIVAVAILILIILLIILIIIIFIRKRKCKVDDDGTNSNNQKTNPHQQDMNELDDSPQKQRSRSFKRSRKAKVIHLPPPIYEVPDPDFCSCKKETENVYDKLKFHRTEDCIADFENHYVHFTATKMLSQQGQNKNLDSVRDKSKHCRDVGDGIQDLQLRKPGTQELTQDIRKSKYTSENIYENYDQEDLATIYQNCNKDQLESCVVSDVHCEDVKAQQGSPPKESVYLSMN